MRTLNFLIALIVMVGLVACGEDESEPRVEVEFNTFVLDDPPADSRFQGGLICVDANISVEYFIEDQIDGRVIPGTAGVDECLLLQPSLYTVRWVPVDGYNTPDDVEDLDVDKFVEIEVYAHYAASN